MKPRAAAKLFSGFEQVLLGGHAVRRQSGKEGERREGCCLAMVEMHLAGLSCRPARF